MNISALGELTYCPYRHHLHLVIKIQQHHVLASATPTKFKYTYIMNVGNCNVNLNLLKFQPNVNCKHKTWISTIHALAHVSVLKNHQISLNMTCCICGPSPSNWPRLHMIYLHYFASLTWHSPFPSVHELVWQW